MRIIAEVGSNFRTIRDCEHSIEYAARAGAHAVKFQYFTPRELYGPWAVDDQPKLRTEWLPILAIKAKHHGIEFMCTAFSPEGYRYIDNFVQTHKIASAEMTHPEILDMVASFGKPVVMSTAGADLTTEIKPALERLKPIGQENITVMFCVGDYPAKVIDFQAMRMLRSNLGGKYRFGYSDHSIDVLNIPMMAKFAGATVIEKHVNFVNVQSPDAPHSLNHYEFTLFCKNLSDQGYKPQESEQLANHDMKLSWRRRIVATKDITQGEEIVMGENVGVFRPRRGKPNSMNALDYRLVFKCKAATNIRAGDPISKDELIAPSPYGI